MENLLTMPEDELKRLIWEDLEAECKEGDGREVLFKYLKMARASIDITKLEEGEKYLVQKINGVVVHEKIGEVIRTHLPKEEKTSMFVILHGGAVYKGSYFDTGEQAANFIKFQNPKRKWRKQTDEDTFVCARNNATFKITQLGKG